MRFGYRPGNGTPDENGLAYYDTVSDVRHLTFGSANGARLFLNYAWLMSGTCTADGTMLTLRFTKQVITLKGRRLDALFESLSMQSPRQILAVKESGTAPDEMGSVVLEIGVAVL